MEIWGAVKSWEFEGKILWNEFCPFHEITGFTLTSLYKVLRSENSEESRLFTGANLVLRPAWSLRGLAIWPKTGPFRDVFWIIRCSTFCTKTHFPENQKSWPKALWELATWAWFRIPLNIPNVRARWVKKTAARFFHSKFETNPPWLMCHFEAFLA